MYHIPEGTAGRIQDFLGMTGLQETQQICQGQDLKRADTTEECIERILRHAMDLADTGPDNLMALAQANIPIEPAVGQAIGFPIPDISIGESVVIVRLYRQVFTATAPAPQPDLNWDPSVLARSALSLAIAAHAAMLVGQTLLDIFVSKSDIITDLKEEDLTCAKDLICTLDDCKGQDEVTERLNWMVSSSTPSTPICRTVCNITHVVASLTVVHAAQEFRMQMRSCRISLRVRGAERIHGCAIRMARRAHHASRRACA